MAQANETIFSKLKVVIKQKVQKIIKDALQHEKYDQLRIKQFSNNICEQIIKLLSNMNKNFKYIVNCTIVPTGNNGLDMSGLFYWDNEMDGSVTIQQQLKYLICIVNVYGCAI